MDHWTEDNVVKALIQKKVITESQSTEVLQSQRQSGKKFTRILIDMNMVPAQKINIALASSGCSDLESYIPDMDLVTKFKEEQVRKQMVMPLFSVESKVFVSMADPHNIEAQQMVYFSTGMNQLRNVSGTREDISKMIDKYFGRRGAILEAMKEANSRKPSEASEDRRFTSVSSVADAPVVKLVDDYIQKALEENASDIHFEPQQDGLRVRFRIDGYLQTVETIPTTLIGPLTSRVKIMSQMKIDQRMIPQDGRFSKIIERDEVDFRVSSFPGIFGESLVLRILHRQMRIPLQDLGLAPAVYTDFQKCLRQDKGIFLVTGPTGCGKTTTLVSMLYEIKDPTKKVVTLENPVEYQVDGTIQGQVHPQAGFTFAKGLRAILRHDPNIIMVAEIRDPETAATAIEAGLTGHFVLSTLHTNNAPSTIIRLLEMGIEPYILASSLIGILAQRLVRTICPHCREAYMPAKDILKAIGLAEIPKNLTLYRGGGCKNCRNTGFKGRTGIFELMLITERMRHLILNQSGSAEIEIEALKSGMRTLREDGIRQALEGVTTLEEIMGVTQELSVD